MELQFTRSGLLKFGSDEAVKSPGSESACSRSCLVLIKELAREPTLVAKK